MNPRTILTVAREAARRDFVRRNRSEVNRLVRVYGILQDTVALALFGMENIPAMTNDPSIREALHIYGYAWQALVSAFHLVCQRALHDSMVLQRNALELAAAAYEVSQDAEALRDFLNRRYKSARAVSKVKRLVPGFGRIYGSLSKGFVHARQEVHGSSTPVPSDAKPEEPLRLSDEAGLVTLGLHVSIVVLLLEVTYLQHPLYVEHFSHATGKRRWSYASKAKPAIRRYDKRQRQLAKQMHAKARRGSAGYS